MEIKRIYLEMEKIQKEIYYFKKILPELKLKDEDYHLRIFINHKLEESNNKYKNYKLACDFSTS